MAETTKNSTVTSVLRFRFVMVVWGETFTDRFLTFALPNQLSIGNLPSFQYRDGSAYIIYTTPADAEVIKGSRGFEMLSEILPVKFQMIDTEFFESGNQYHTVAQCQAHALNSEANEGCAFITLSPDEIFSDGAFRAVGAAAQRGKRAVLVPGLMLSEDTFVAAVLNNFYSVKEHTLTTPARELTKLALEHLAPIMKASFWNSNAYNISATQLLWTVPGRGIISRTFTPQPLMYFPRVPVSSFDSTLDGGNFLDKAFPNSEELYLVPDSDEIINVSIVDSDYSKRIKSTKASSVFRTARYVASNTTRLQHRLVKHTYRYLYEDLSPDWKLIQAESDRVVKTIGRLLWLQPIFWVLDWRITMLKAKMRLGRTRLWRIATRKL